MALPDSHYVVAFPPQICFRDKDSGLPLSAGLVYFYKDTDRSVLKDVYQQVQLPDNTYEFVALPNPITLTSIGTFGDDSGNDILVYTFPYQGTPSNPGEEPELYYLEVYSSDNVLQFTREAYPPNAVGVDGGAVDAAGNEILNPQFVQVLFEAPSGSTVYTVSVSGIDNEIQIAPNWTLVTTGSGTVTLSQISITSTDVPSNPPYALQLSTAGSITEVYLRQRFTASPRLLWAANLQGSLLAAGVSPTAVVNVTMSWVPSAGSSYEFFSSPTSSSGGFTPLSGVAALDETANPDIAPDGYVDVIISFTPITTVQITSIQIVEVENTSSVAAYIQESTPKQINGLFNYYLPLLEFKPIPSLLTGWDFPLNPAQLGTTGNISASGAYIWDQTIAARGSTNIAYARNSVTGGLQFTTAGSVPDAFYIMQYLSGSQAKKMVGTRLSVNMFAYRGSAGGAVTCRIYLYRATAAATFPSLGTTIGTLAGNGVFTLTAAGWTLINRSSLGTPVFTLSTASTNDEINGSDNDYGYSGWEITDASEIADTDKFAIVVTFSYAAINTVITVNSISVVPGDIPTRPAPQTYNQVLEECQYYYETSFAPGAVATATRANSLCAPMNAFFNSGTSEVSCEAAPFGLEYKTVKRTAPTLAFYSGASATANRVTAMLSSSSAGLVLTEATFSTFFTTLTGGAGVYGTSYTTLGGLALAGPTSSSNAGAAGMFYHYVANARLGEV